MEKEIISLIRERGPLTGQEISRETSEEDLVLWRACMASSSLAIRTLGTRYLRFDRRIEGLARLSPSILREFLTYSLIGLREDPAALSRRTAEIAAHIEEVSRSKRDLAFNVVSSIANRLVNEGPVTELICFIIAGDIVYNMAHDVPRPERSTGKLVNGSDMDLVVIVDDLFPRSLMERLDESIYREKTRLLMTPHLREEIDYVVKDMDRVREQVRFDSFKHMVACKILNEGTLVFGSGDLFRRVKDLLKEHGVVEKLTAMEDRARLFRKRAEEILLSEDINRIKTDHLDLFHPAEESEEFE